MFKVQTFNKISDKGLNRFSTDKYALSDSTDQADAYILRSHKLHNEVIPDSVKAIARAGAGVNNVPVDKCSEKGIVVFNTPGANANAVKELVLAGMLLSSRGILPGIQYAEGLGDINDAAIMHKQLEAEKKRFAGSELAGKTLGIVGLGAIGSLVADMALALGMKVIGFDPALSVEAAWRLSSQVTKMDGLSSLLANADYVTLHVPAIEPTYHLVNDAALSTAKKGLVLLNFARESIVDPAAVVASLNSDNLGGYVCDFPEPCLIGHSKVIAMPHIGASTAEAEENCAVMAADQLMDYLENGNIKNSVNFPAVAMARDGNCRLTFSNENVSGVLGEVLSVFTKHKLNVVDMVNKSRGNIAYNILDIESQVSELVAEEIRVLEHVISVRIL